MDNELQNKHIQNRKLKKEIKKICTELKRTVSLIILNTCFHEINIALKSKLKKITKRYDTKLINIKVPSELPQFTSKTLLTIFHHINCPIMN